MHYFILKMLLLYHNLLFYAFYIYCQNNKRVYEGKFIDDYGLKAGRHDT
jgi:hypothetical protein